MKIYTKGGDKGITSLIGGERVAKSDPRIEAYGTVDELSSFLGLLYDKLAGYDNLALQRSEILKILSILMNIEALFAADESYFSKLAQVEERHIEAVEQSIDSMNNSLPATFSFTLPCGNTLISTAHICRTICRRAERRAIEASQHFVMHKESLRYLNRLSDYLFTLSRFFAVKEGIEESIWNSKI